MSEEIRTSMLLGMKSEEKIFYQPMANILFS